MKIYIDSDYKCHISSGEGLREFEDEFFDGKCPEFIEGFRYIPDGETWERSDGMKCCGISAWKPYDKLYIVQAEYEHNLLNEYEAALTEIETALGGDF